MGIRCRCAVVFCCRECKVWLASSLKKRVNFLLLLFLLLLLLLLLLTLRLFYSRFSVRRLYGTYFNLNSLLSAPERVSDFYLASLLGQFKQDGYDVFVVKGRVHWGGCGGGVCSWCEECFGCRCGRRRGL
jgi:hypothetical protein